MGEVQIAKVRYTHDAIIDEILVDPSISQNELAKRFGFTAAWMSIIVNSDAFQNRLAERKGELIDPKITASIEQRLESLAKFSLDRLLERVESSVPLKPMELVAMAKLGAGDRANRPAGPPVSTNLYVVNLPPVAQNSSEWLSSARRPPGVSQIPQKVDGGFTPFVELPKEPTEGRGPPVPCEVLDPYGYPKSILFDLKEEGQP